MSSYTAHIECPRTFIGRGKVCPQRLALMQMLPMAEYFALSLITHISIQGYTHSLLTVDVKSSSLL